MKRCMKYFCSAVKLDHCIWICIMLIVLSAVCSVVGAVVKSSYTTMLSVIWVVTGIESNSVFSLRTKLIASSAISEKYQCVFLPMINAAARALSLVIIVVPVIAELCLGADRIYYIAYLLTAAAILAAEGLAAVLSAVCVKSIMGPLLFMELPVFVGTLFPLNELAFNTALDSGINAFLTSVGIGGAVAINIAVILLFWLLHYFVSVNNYRNDRITRVMDKATLIIQ